jgi:hypothetical protein
MATNEEPYVYDYTNAGFDPFLTRSIDTIGAPNLQLTGDAAPSQELNYDQSQTSGSLGSALQIGNIILDGTTGRISIIDENGNTVVEIGDIGD